MAIGKRKRHANQASMWVATQDLPRTAAHPFYARLNQILDQHDFDGYVEELCQRFYEVASHPNERLEDRIPCKHGRQVAPTVRRSPHSGRGQPPAGGWRGRRE